MVMGCVGFWEGVMLGVRVGLSVRVGLGVRVTLGDGVGVSDEVGEGVAVNDGLGVGVSFGVFVSDGVRLAVGEVVRSSVGEGVGEGPISVAVPSVTVAVAVKGEEVVLLGVSSTIELIEISVGSIKGFATGRG
jgi:hypothetical protein